MATQTNLTWYQAVLRAASDAGIDLPTTPTNAMGTVLWRSPDGGRAVSLKRRLVAANSTDRRPVLWKIWLELGESVSTLATGIEELEPTPVRVQFFLSVVRKWLIDLVSTDEIRQFVGEDAWHEGREIAANPPTDSAVP